MDSCIGRQMRYKSSLIDSQMDSAGATQNVLSGKKRISLICSGLTDLFGEVIRGGKREYAFIAVNEKQ
jgi:hypothetical protein